MGRLVILCIMTILSLSIYSKDVDKGSSPLTGEISKEIEDLNLILEQLKLERSYIDKLLENYNSLKDLKIEQLEKNLEDLVETQDLKLQVKAEEINTKISSTNTRIDELKQELIDLEEKREISYENGVNKLNYFLTILLAILTVAGGIFGFVGLGDFRKIRNDTKGELSKIERQKGSLDKLLNKLIKRSKKYLQTETKLETFRDELDRSKEKLDELVLFIRNESTGVDLSVISIDNINSDLSYVNGIRREHQFINMLNDNLKSSDDYFISFLDLYVSKNYSNALSCIDKALELSKSNEDTTKYLYNKATFMLKNNKKPEAEKIYNELLEIYPSHYKAMNNLAYIYFDSKKLKEAKEYYLKLIEINDSDWHSYIGLTAVYIKQGNSEEAELMLSVSEGFSDGSTDYEKNYHYNKACILAMQSNYDLAKLSLQEAISIDESLYTEAIRDEHLKEIVKLLYPDLK